MKASVDFRDFLRNATVKRTFTRAGRNAFDVFYNGRKMTILDAPTEQRAKQKALHQLMDQ